MTKERTKILTDYLVENKDKAKELFNLPIEEANERINAEGFDFTVEELKDFAEEVQIYIENNEGELNESDMDAIVGGVTGLEVAVAMGTIYGAYEACKWAWNTGTWLGTKYVNWRKKR